MRNRFYITTPIYYVNDKPHIGHTCTVVASDIVARYYRQKGREVFFLTGTDEHGEKVAESAKKRGLEPQEFCDKLSSKFRNTWKKLNISNNFFIRTTDPRHIKVVQNFLLKIWKNGDIYKGKYEGFYCVGCEKFLTEKDLVNNRCPYHPNKEISFRSEENYFFRLSKYAPKLIKLIENDEKNYIYPEGKRKEIISRLKSGIEDVSISREKVKWGVPFPWDPGHTVYVWVDALINYYSATRFLKDKEDFWPADIHLIGKEILWFHTVIWQAMLMSAGIVLPKKVFAHSFYTIDGKKMSKSMGNVISPDDMMRKFGIDGTRYLIASSFPAEDDADVGWKKFSEKYNADLSNNLGNLISRVGKLAQNFTLTAPETVPMFYSETEIALKKLRIPAALEFIWLKKIDHCNMVLNREKPWEKPKKVAKKTLNKIIKEIQVIAYNLRPFMPETAEKIEEIFSPGKPIKPPEQPLFPRIS